MLFSQASLLVLVYFISHKFMNTNEWKKIQSVKVAKKYNLLQIYLDVNRI